MHEQGIGLLIEVFRPGKGTTLTTVMRIMHGILVGDLCHTQTLLTDAEAGDVHHDKHCREAFVLFAHQIAGRAIIVHHTGRIAVNTHLMFDRAARERIAFAERAILIHQEFRNDEKGNALHIIGSIWCFRQNEMDDILRQVMLTG